MSDGKYKSNETTVRTEVTLQEIKDAILSKDDGSLELRRLLGDEAEAHRAFLERQIRLLVGILSIILALGSFLFFYFFGKSSSDLQKQLEIGIDKSLIDYQVLKAHQDRVAEMVRAAVNSAEVDKEIRESVAIQTREAVQNEIEDIIAKEVQLATAELKGLDLKDFVDKSFSSLRTSVSRLESDLNDMDSAVKADIAVLSRRVSESSDASVSSVEQLAQQLDSMGRDFPVPRDYHRHTLENNIKLDLLESSSKKNAERIHELEKDLGEHIKLASKGDELEKLRGDVLERLNEFRATQVEATDTPSTEEPP